MHRRGKRLKWVLSGSFELRSPEAVNLPPPPTCSPNDELYVHIEEASVLEPYALTMIAAQCHALREQGVNVYIVDNMQIASNRFARSLGLVEAVNDEPPRVVEEPHRTYAITKVAGYKTMERFAIDVSHKLSGSDGQLRQAAKYCLVELLRNAFDHTKSLPFASAQVVYAGKGGRDNSGIQISVSDYGPGIRSTIAPQHKWVETDSMAIDAAIQPHISSTFPKGVFSMMKDNAGLGLHFISQLIEKSDGRLAIRTGSHIRYWEFNENSKNLPVPSMDTKNIKGTTVAFEFYTGMIFEYKAFFDTLRERVASIKNIANNQRVLVRADTPTNHSAPTCTPNLAGEDTAEVRRFRRDVLIPRLRAHGMVSIDLRRYKYLSPSFSHALIYEAVREAALAGSKIEIVRATDAAWATLTYVEEYALTA